MIINSQQIEGCRIAGLEGARARLKDLYFDDQDWSVQYLVASLGGKTFSPEVVLRPESVCGFNPAARVLNVDLTAEQLAGSQPARMIKPICLQYQLHPGARGHASVFRPDSMSHCLRSIRAVLGYSLRGQGNHAGKLAGFQLDLELWAITGITVEKEMLGKKLLFVVNPAMVERISFAAGQVRLKDSNPMVIESLPVKVWGSAEELVS